MLNVLNVILLCVIVMILFFNKKKKVNTKLVITLLALGILTLIIFTSYNKMKTQIFPTKENYAYGKCRPNTSGCEYVSTSFPIQVTYKLPNVTNKVYDGVFNPRVDYVLDFSDPKKTYPSWNQKLVGPANPKFNLNAPIIPKADDLDEWRANPFVIHSHINDTSRFDMEQSGYNTHECDDQDKTTVSRDVVENTDTYDISIEKFKSTTSQPQKTEASSVEHFIKDKSPTIIDPSLIGTLANDFSVTNDDNDYSKNIYTMTLQPGVYSYNMVSEPVQVAAGIGFARPFQPSLYSVKDGQIMYTQIDPQQVTPIPIPEQPTHEPTMDNVYDPRFTGYSSNDRCYIDNMTGQPRYFYKDIDSVRIPNYIVRSKIDFLSDADSYGPLTDKNVNGNINTKDIHKIANDAYMNNSIMQRTELQERLMRKSAEMIAQRRIAPIRRF